jgi:hypothetical protein
MNDMYKLSVVYKSFLQVHLAQWLASSRFQTGVLVFCVGVHCISFLRSPFFLYLMGKLVQ